MNPTSSIERLDEQSRLGATTSPNMGVRILTDEERLMNPGDLVNSWFLRKMAKADQQPVRESTLAMPGSPDQRRFPIPIKLPRGSEILKYVPPLVASFLVGAFSNGQVILNHLSPTSEGYPQEQSRSLRDQANQQLDQLTTNMIPGDDNWREFHRRQAVDFLKAKKMAVESDLGNLFYGRPKKVSISNHTPTFLTSGTVADVTTYNWVGWGAFGGHYFEIQGLLNVPILDCTNSQGDLSSWISISDSSYKRLEQAGVDVQCYNGQENITHWGESFPDFTFNLQGRMRLRSNDPLGVKITELGGSFKVEMKNFRNKDHAQATHSTSTNSSDQGEADVINEIHNGLVPNFTTTTFSHISVTDASGLKPFNATSGSEARYSIVDTTGKKLAQASELNATGDGFTVTNMTK